MKNLFIAAGVLLAILLGVYFIIRPKPPAPEIQRLADLTELAERTCLSNTTDSNSLALKVQLDAMKKIDGKASIEQQHSAARGAAQAFTGELQKQEKHRNSRLHGSLVQADPRHGRQALDWTTDASSTTTSSCFPSII